jgi:hypothetical protein
MRYDGDLYLFLLGTGALDLRMGRVDLPQSFWCFLEHGVCLYYDTLKAMLRSMEANRGNSAQSILFK